MPRDNEHNPDPNVNAARIVAESTKANPNAANDLEALRQLRRPYTPLSG